MFKRHNQIVKEMAKVGQTGSVQAAGGRDKIAIRYMKTHLKPKLAENNSQEDL